MSEGDIVFREMGDITQNSQVVGNLGIGLFGIGEGEAEETTKGLSLP